MRPRPALAVEGPWPVVDVAELIIVVVCRLHHVEKRPFERILPLQDMVPTPLKGALHNLRQTRTVGNRSGRGHLENLEIYTKQ